MINGFGIDSKIKAMWIAKNRRLSNIHWDLGEKDYTSINIYYNNYAIQKLEYNASIIAKFLTIVYNDFKKKIDKELLKSCYGENPTITDMMK